MKWNVDDIPIFLAVVDKNGITAAADFLGIPKSTVSTALTRLEQGLGLRLLERNSRNIRVTGEGETFYRQAQIIMEQVREADATMAGMSIKPSGTLSVALPPAFCQEIIAPKLPLFHESYPEIELELVITTHNIALLRDQVDIVIAVGPLEDSEMISKVLMSGKLVWVTSPEYLSKITLGDCPEDIIPHIQLCETRYGITDLPVQIGNQTYKLDLSHGVTHVNDPLVVRRAVMNGAGISLLPARYCSEQLRDGSLIEINNHMMLDLSASKLTAIYPSRRLMSPKIRVFLEFLEDVCKFPRP